MRTLNTTYTFVYVLINNKLDSFIQNVSSKKTSRAAAAMSETGNLIQMHVSLLSRDCRGERFASFCVVLVHFSCKWIIIEINWYLFKWKPSACGMKTTDLPYQVKLHRVHAVMGVNLTHNFKVFLNKEQCIAFDREYNARLASNIGTKKMLAWKIYLWMSKEIIYALPLCRFHYKMM